MTANPDIAAAVASAETMTRIVSMVSLARAITQDDSDAICVMLGAVVIIARGYGDAGAVHVVESAIRALEASRDRLAVNAAAATPAPAAAEAS